MGVHVAKVHSKLTLPNGYALRSELSWTYYRLLMRVENDNARQFYMDEAVKSQWSTRQLERQINTFFYERLLSSKNKEEEAMTLAKNARETMGRLFACDPAETTDEEIAGIYERAYK